MSVENSSSTADAATTVNMSVESISGSESPSAVPVLEQWTVDLLGRIAGELGFSDFRLHYSSGSNVGDNFMGVMLRVRIEGKRNGSGADDQSHTLMLKMPPNSAARRKQFNSAVLFERETMMYRDTLPMFVQFQLDKGLTPDGAHGFFTFPKCHAFVCDAERDRYAIVMEDLKEQGYRMFNKYDIIDLAHVRLVMEELGKFHGVSFALRDQRPELFEPLTELEDVFLKHVIRDNLEMMQGFIDMAFTRAINTLDEDEVGLRAKVNKLRNGFLEQMDSCVQQGAGGQFSVINHGDCWNNNMMYLYKGSSVPHHICLIDFQISRCASPVLDLVYFLFTSTTKEMRDAHLEEVLSIYHTALSATVNRLDSDADRLFSYADFRQQLTKFGKYGAMIAPMLLQVITADAADIPDLDKLADEREQNGGKMDTTLFMSKKTELLYNKRMSDVMRDADAYGFLNDL